MKGKVCSALVLVLIFGSVALVVAQAIAKNKLKTRLPRIGTIKDYPATGMMTGCGNLYFEFPRTTESLTTEYVYLARGDGTNAWLNLDGRDTRLKFLKTQTVKSGSGKTKYYYRSGKTQITVSITNSGPYDDDYHLRMIITLRRGHSVRRVKAIGSSDC